MFNLFEVPMESSYDDGDGQELDLFSKESESEYELKFEKSVDMSINKHHQFRVR